MKYIVQTNTPSGIHQSINQSPFKKRQDAQPLSCLHIYSHTLTKKQSSLPPSSGTNSPMSTSPPHLFPSGTNWLIREHIAPTLPHTGSRTGCYFLAPPNPCTHWGWPTWDQSPYANTRPSPVRGQSTHIPTHIPPARYHHTKSKPISPPPPTHTHTSVDQPVHISWWTCSIAGTPSTPSLSRALSAPCSGCAY